MTQKELNKLARLTIAKLLKGKTVNINIVNVAIEVLRIPIFLEK